MHDPVSFHTINPQQAHSVLPGLIINRHKIITLIGGGGKTGLMYLWARSLQAAGYSVVTTTTTKLSARDCPGIEFCTASSLSDAILLLSGEPAELPGIAQALRLSAHFLARHWLRGERLEQLRERAVGTAGAGG